jgi:dolichol-phosphate mannosyltransferase
MASKYTIALLGPAIILFMLIDPRSRRWFFKPQPYLAAITALLIFSPVILWNYQHEWASFLFQSQRRLASVFRFSTPELFGAILLLLTPTGLYAVWTSSRLHHRQTADQSRVDDHGQRHRLFALCMALAPLSVFIFVSFSREVKLSWAGPLWLACIPLMAASLSSREARIKNQPFGQRLWTGTILVLVLNYGVILHYFSLGLPGIPYDSNAFLFGGEDLALQVEQTVERVAEERGSRPLVVGMDKYRLASGMAFYRNKAEHSENTQHAKSVQETTGRQIFGMDALMYNYWLTPADAIGRDLLVISERKEYLADHLLAESGQHLANIKSYSIKKHGKEVGSYYYRLVTRHAADHPAIPMPVVSNRTKNPHSVIDSI